MGSWSTRSSARFLPPEQVSASVGWVWPDPVRPENSRCCCSAGSPSILNGNRNGRCPLPFHPLRAVCPSMRPSSRRAAAAGRMDGELTSPPNISMKDQKNKGIQCSPTTTPTKRPALERTRLHNKRQQVHDDFSAPFDIGLDSFCTLFASPLPGIAFSSDRLSPVRPVGRDHNVDRWTAGTLAVASTSPGSSVSSARKCELRMRRGSSLGKRAVSFTVRLMLEMPWFTYELNDTLSGFRLFFFRKP